MCLCCHYRYRILKCLLSSEARLISPVYVDLQLFSTLTCAVGTQVVLKLAKVIGDYGCTSVKDTILTSLCSFPSTISSLSVLLHSGANPTAYLSKSTYNGRMTLDAAILLVVASNDSRLLAKIDCDSSSNIRDVTSLQKWPFYKTLLIYLTISGYQFQLHVVDYLYYNHAHMYLCIFHYFKKPRPLSHLCRQAIRIRLLPNTTVGVSALPILPEAVKRYLLFGGNIMI